jgi:thiosulfate/3-mercaptopyruvate sulfurtransferase
MEHMPGYRQLVYPEWVAALTRGETPPEVTTDDVLIAEVVCRGLDESFSRGHIPGAIQVDTNEIEADEELKPRNWWNLLPDHQLVRAIEGMGITRQTCVIVYGHSTLPAARLAFALLYAGVEDVRVLDGGYRAWVARGLPTETGLASRRAPRPFGRISPRRSYRKTIAEIRSSIGSRDLTLADVRSWNEYTGATSGYPYVRPRGRIPGARFAHGGPSAHCLSEYFDAHGSFRVFTHVRRMWQKFGIGPGSDIAFYCGTGWRASVAFLLAHWMGWSAAVCDGGWFEWSSGPDAPLNPVETGDP